MVENILYVNYYEEYRKYESGSGNSILIDKNKSIVSSSLFPIFGRSNHLENTKNWEHLFNTILGINYKNIDTFVKDELFKDLIGYLKNNREIPTNLSSQKNLSYFLSNIESNFLKSTGMVLKFNSSNTIEECIEKNKNNIKLNKNIIKKYTTKIKKDIKLDSKSSLKNSKTLNELLNIESLRIKLEKEGVNTKTKYSLTDRFIELDNEDKYCLKISMKLEIEQNGNYFDINKFIKETEESKLLTKTKKVKLTQLMTEYKKETSIFSSEKTISLNLIQTILNNDKYNEKLPFLKQMKDFITPLYNNINNLDYNNNQNNLNKNNSLGM